MNNKEFDDIIKEQLSNIDDNTKGTWDTMKSLLEGELIVSEGSSSLEDIDKDVKSALDGYEIPFNKSHQQDFINQYKIIQLERKTKLYHFISRVAIVLLLIFSCINLYNPYGLFTSEQDQYVSVDVIGQSHKRSNTETISKNLLVKNSSSSIQDEKITHNIGSNIAKTKLISVAGNYNKAKLIPAVSNSKIVNTNASVNNQSSKIIRKKSSFIEYIANINLKKHLVENIGNDVVINKEYSTESIVSKNNSFAIGGWVSQNNNKNHDYTSSNTTTTSIGTGVSISKKLGKFELETGIDYTRVHYKPSDNDNYYGTKKHINSLKVTDVDLLVSSIPIQLKHHVELNNDTRFYSTIGATYNTVLVNKSKTIVAKNINSRNPTNIISREKPSIAGALENGDVFDNSYLTASVGFGLERNIGSNNIVFLEPSFEVQIKPHSLLRTNDKYQGLNLRLGVKRVI